MRARPSGDRLRFFLRFGVAVVSGCTFGGLPAFRFGTVTADPAARGARASLSVAISASISAITSFTGQCQVLPLNLRFGTGYNFSQTDAVFAAKRSMFEKIAALPTALAAV